MAEDCRRRPWRPRRARPLNKGKGAPSLEPCFPASLPLPRPSPLRRVTSLTTRQGDARRSPGVAAVSLLVPVTCQPSPHAQADHRSGSLLVTSLRHKGQATRVRHARLNPSPCQSPTLPTEIVLYHLPRRRPQTRRYCTPPPARRHALEEEICHLPPLSVANQESLLLPRRRT